MKNKVYPPDMALAKFGLARQLFDRIRGKKDRIKERTANGKAIYAHRELVELSGDPANVETESLLIEDTAHAIYQSKDSTVYLVSPDVGMHVAEAVSQGKSIWSYQHHSLTTLIHEIYRLFPKHKATEVKPPSNPETMDVRSLETLIRRKKMELKKEELMKYGEREDFAELPETTPKQREEQMREGRPQRIEDTDLGDAKVIEATA